MTVVWFQVPPDKGKLYEVLAPARSVVGNFSAALQAPGDPLTLKLDLVGATSRLHETTIIGLATNSSDADPEDQVSHQKFCHGPLASLNRGVAHMDLTD